MPIQHKFSRLLYATLFFLMGCVASKAQVPAPAGFPSPYSTGWYRIGFVQEDSAGIYAVRDTTIRPRFAGFRIMWQHSGRDTSIWVYNGSRYVKELNAQDTLPGRFLVTTSFLASQAFLKNITGYIQQGTNVVITGAGTLLSPYVINATASGGTDSAVNPGLFLSQTISLTTKTLFADTSISGFSGYYLRRKDSSLYVTQNALSIGLAGKQNIIAVGTTLQYIRGDGSLATFPTNLSAFTNDPGYITTNQSITFTAIGDINGTYANPTFLNPTLTINANVVSYSKIQAAAGQGLMGAQSAGNFQLVTIGTGLIMSGGVLSATGSGTGTGLDTLWRTPGKDSIQFTIEGRYHSILDSASGGGGAVGSVSNSDGTLTISPTTGAVVASLNLSHSNTWGVSANQTFNGGIIIGSAVTFSSDNTFSIGNPSAGANAVYARFLNSNGILTLGAAAANQILFAVGGVSKMQLMATGQLQLNTYTTSTSYTGTAISFLQTDASGNVIQIPVASVQGQLSNRGSAFRIFDPTTNGIKSLSCTGCTLDSLVSGQLNITVSAAVDSGIIVRNGILASRLSTGPSVLLQVDSSAYTTLPRLQKPIDSLGILIGGKQATLSNGGSGFRWFVPSATIRSFVCVGCTLDSTSNAGALTLTVTAGGSGTVTTFSAGNLSPLFTTSVATATTTPALTFSLSTAAANTVFGNLTGSTAVPSFGKVPIAALATNTANTLIGFDGSGNPIDITAGTGISISAGVISSTGGSSNTPTVVGATFSKNNMSSTDFPSPTATVTYSGGKPTISGGTSSTDTTHYISLTDTSYYERWHKTIRFILPTKTATSRGIALGVRSTNPTLKSNIVVAFDASTDANSYKVYFTNLGTTYATSVTALSGSAGDTCILDVEKNLDTLYGRVINIMTATPSIAQLKYTFTIGSGGSSLENTGVTAVWSLGDAVLLDSLGCSSNELKFANLMILGDSKTQGYVQQNFTQTFAAQIGRYFGTYVNAGATGDHVSDVQSRLKQVYAMAPKQVLLTIGSNDVGNEAGFEAGYVAIHDSLVAHGITVIVPTPMYESARNLAVEYAFIKGKYPSAIDVYNPIKNCNCLVDGTHFNLVGADTVAKTLIASNQISGGTNSFIPNGVINAPTGYILKSVNGWNISGPSALTDLGDSIRFFEPMTGARIILTGPGFPALYFGDQTSGVLNVALSSSGGNFNILKVIGGVALFQVNQTGQVALNNTTATLTIGGGAGATPLTVNSNGNTVVGVINGQLRLGNPSTGTFAGLSIARQSDNSFTFGTFIYQPDATTMRIQVGGGDRYFFGASANSFGVGIVPAHNLHVIGDGFFSDSLVVKNIRNGVSGTDSILVENGGIIRKISPTIGGSQTFDQVLTTGGTLTTPHTVTNTGQLFTWANGGTGTFSFTGLRTDTAGTLGVYIYRADSSIARITLANLAAELPAFNLFAANGLTAAGGDSLYWGGTLNQNTVINASASNFNVTLGGTNFLGTFTTNFNTSATFNTGSGGNVIFTGNGVRNSQFVASDANLTIGASNNGMVIVLPNTTANRTVTITGAATGQTYEILNLNTSTSSNWSFATTIQNPNNSGAVSSIIPQGRSKIYYNGSAWILLSQSNVPQAQDQTGLTTVGSFGALGATGYTATYRVDAYLTINSVSVDQIQLIVSYTDETSTSRNIVMVPTGGTTGTLTSPGVYSYSYIVRVKSGSGIIPSTSLAVSGGSINYDLGTTFTLVSY